MRMIKLIASARKFLMLGTLLVLSVALTGCEPFLQQLAGPASSHSDTSVAATSLAAKSSKLLSTAERDALVQKLLTRPAVQQLKAWLESQGLRPKLKKTEVFQVGQGNGYVTIPFAPKGELNVLVKGRRVLPTALVKQGQHLITKTPGEPEQRLVLLTQKQLGQLLKSLRQSASFRQREERWRTQGREISPKTVALVNEQKGQAVLFIITGRQQAKKALELQTVAVPQCWECYEYTDYSFSSYTTVDVSYTTSAYVAVSEPVYYEPQPVIYWEPAPIYYDPLPYYTEPVYTQPVESLVVSQVSLDTGWDYVYSEPVIIRPEDVNVTLADTYTAVQQTSTNSQPPAVFIQDRDLNLLLHGYENLTDLQIGEFVTMGHEAVGAPTKLPLSPAPDCAVQAFTELLGYLNDTSGFAQKVAQWETSCSAFKEFTQKLQLNTQDWLGALKNIVSLQQGLNTQEFQQSVAALLGGCDGKCILLLLQIAVEEGRIAIAANLTASEFLEFDNLILNLVIKIIGCSQCKTNAVLENLLNRLRNVEERSHYTGVLWELKVAVQLGQNGWDIIDFSRQVGVREIDMIAMKDIAGLGKGSRLRGGEGRVSG